MLRTLSFLASFLSSPAFALDCAGAKYVVQTFTNYSPHAGGINGRCGGSASGLDACQWSVEKYWAGTSTAVMGAVPQRGGSSNLFGGIYSATLSGFPQGAVMIFAGDRYGDDSDNLSKMDLVTDTAKGDIPTRVNSSDNGVLVNCGRGIPQLLTIPVRKVARDPAAVAPVRDRTDRGREI